MLLLKVPYSEKDQAKALGARWNNERKAWYVPDGQPSAPFERWLAPQTGDLPVKTARVDSYAKEPVVGAHYLALTHDCSPFPACAACLPVLEKAGWIAAHQIVKKAIAAL